MNWFRNELHKVGKWIAVSAGLVTLPLFISGCATAGFGDLSGKVVEDKAYPALEIGVLSIKYQAKNSKWPQSLKDLRVFSAAQKLDSDLQNYTDCSFMVKSDTELSIRFQYKSRKSEKETGKEEVDSKKKMIHLKVTGTQPGMLFNYEGTADLKPGL